MLTKICLVLTLAFYITGIANAQNPSLSHSLLNDFDDILFVERFGKVRHMCDQYFGGNSSTGGGLFLLKNFKNENPQKVDILKGLKVPEGTNAGMLMSDGAFMSPDLSWNGKTVLFAWSSGGTEKWITKNRLKKKIDYSCVE